MGCSSVSARTSIRDSIDILQHISRTTSEMNGACHGDVLYVVVVRNYWPVPQICNPCR